jgi:hypothetical protein
MIPSRRLPRSFASRIKAGAAKLKADRAARAEAKAVIDLWNRFNRPLRQ